MPFTVHTENDHAIFNANGAIAAVPTNDPVFAGLVEKVDYFTKEATQAEPVIRPEALGAHLQSKAAPPVLSALSSAINAARREKQEFAAADVEVRTPATSTPRTNEPERRAPFRDMDMADMMGRIERADLPTLTALVADGNLADLPEPAWERASERYLVANVVEKVGLSASYSRKPSLDGGLLAVGVDRAAVEKAGEVVVQGHRARLEQAEGRERTLQSVVGYLSAALELSPADTLNRVLAA